jgi:hypothetical protein
MRAPLRVLLVSVVLTMSSIQPANAATPQHIDWTASAHHALGIVPARGVSRAPTATSGNLMYHGGAVMRTNKTYAIYWVPSGWSMVSGYRSTINKYFSNVADDSGSKQNVYSTETQYFDSTGSIAYAQAFGGSTTASNPFPPNGCPSYDGLRACLSDAQISAQVRQVIASKGWVAGPTRAFFLFLPKNVGTCDDYGSSACAFTAFCGYHSWVGSGSSQVVYANMPYADTDPAGCSTGQRPNGTDADDTLNIASHEHREMIEDLSGDGWYDAAGNEGADKCAWRFGPSLGSTSTGLYNQVINGYPYYLQEEWTNARALCVQRGI